MCQLYPHNRTSIVSQRHYLSREEMSSSPRRQKDCKVKTVSQTETETQASTTTVIPLVMDGGRWNG